MWHAAVATSTDLGLEAAIREAAGAARARLPVCGEVLASPAFALIAVGTAHGVITPAVLECARDALGPGCVLAGLHTEGLLADGIEEIATPAVAVLALSGVDARAVALDHLRGHEAELGEQIEAELGPLCERDLLLVSCDAHDVEPSALAAGLGACAPAAVLGLGVEGCGGARAAHFAGSEIRTEGALAVRLRAPLAVAVCIAAGTRPLASRSVTLARGHWVISIDGRPALDAFREAAGALSEDPRRASRSVFAYVEGALSGSSCAGAVVGFDEAEGTIGLSLAVSTGDRIVFAQRDPLAARSALAAAAGELAAAAPPAPGQLGLATTSRTRGPALFGQPGIESGYLSSGFPAADWLGLVGSFQIVASPQLPPRLLNLSSVLARLF